MTVRLLPEHVVNQIAAGEVVERPASVVKELVENALDAGATTLTVGLRGGGASRIRVVDDGSGMDRQDALLSLERHATSKLRAAEDLVGIATLGFRGEAIPSIASVSRFTLETRTPDTDVGTRIRVEHGKLVDVADCGCPVGTQIDVRELFGSVPARRKFLRSSATELEHCTEAVIRQALIRPDVEVRVTSEDRETLRLVRADDVAARVKAALGAPDLLVADDLRGSARVRAWLAPPSVHQAAGGLYLYVGGRYVRDPVLRRAVADAWRDLLPRGRFPVGVVAVEIPGEDLDVNVHPAKVEVRFRDPRGVTEAVVATLRGLVERRGVPAVDESRSRAAIRADVPVVPGAIPLPLPAHPDEDRRFTYTAPEPVPAPRMVAEPPTPVLAPPPPVDVQPSTRTPPPSTTTSWRTHRVVGQVGDRWLVLDRDGVLVLLDRVAVDERRLRAALADGDRAHALVAPVRVPVGEFRTEKLTSASDTLARWGLVVERFGPREVVCTSVPAVAVQRDVGELVREMPLTSEEIPAFLARRCARAGDPLTPFEARALLLELDEAGADPAGPPKLAVSLDPLAAFRAG